MKELANQAFSTGYHSERLPDATHSVHNLKHDASAIALALPNGEAMQTRIHEALLYGVEPSLFPDVEGPLGTFASQGDQIIIWTQGDPDAQRAKVRQLGWETALSNPRQRGNFAVFAAEDKLPKLLNIRAFARRVGSDQQIFILDDRVENLTAARELLQADENTHFMLMDRTGAPIDTPEGVVAVGSMLEYQGYVDEKSGTNSVTHVLDLDGTLINPKGSEESRRQAVIKTITEETNYPKPPRSRYVAFNGFHVADSHGSFGQLTQRYRRSVEPESNEGYQATIYRAGDILVKALVVEDGKRPQTPEWQQLGGYRGTQKLIDELNSYRDRLNVLGFPVPEAQFLMARTNDGKFFPIESVLDHGESLAQPFTHGAPSEKIALTREMLEISYPVFMAENIGADIKPANFVRDDQGVIRHIDAFPYITADEATGEVTTEFPRIEAPEIQEFLYETHISPLAIGYRFYQELCQMDVGMRTQYREAINTTLRGWQEDGKITTETAEAINQAMHPKTSEVLEAILLGNMDPEEGFMMIEQELHSYDTRGAHPIYALREMGFALSEYLLYRGDNVATITDHALPTVVRDTLGREETERIAGALKATRQDLSLITLVRKLTHISDHAWQAGIPEYTAFNVIKHITKQALAA